MDSPQVFTFNFSFGTRTFELRTNMGPAAADFYIAHIDELRAWEAMPTGTPEQHIAAARAGIAIFFPTSEQCDATMRMMLKGDHDGIEWAYDGGIATMSKVFTAWHEVVKGSDLKPFLPAEPEARKPRRAPSKKSARKR